MLERVLPMSLRDAQFQNAFQTHLRSTDFKYYVNCTKR